MKLPNVIVLDIKYKAFYNVLYMLRILTLLQYVLGNAIYRNYSEQGTLIGNPETDSSAGQRDGASLLIDAIGGGMFEGAAAEDSSLSSKLEAEGNHSADEPASSGLASKLNKKSSEESSDEEMNGTKKQSNKQSENNNSAKASESAEDEQ